MRDDDDDDDDDAGGEPPATMPGDAGAGAGEPAAPAAADMPLCSGVRGGLAGCPCFHTECLVLVELSLPLALPIKAVCAALPANLPKLPPTFLRKELSPGEGGVADRASPALAEFEADDAVPLLLLLLLVLLLLLLLPVAV